jgi:phosphoesterase RecJ-like protein
MTDTNSFRYARTTSSAHQIAGQMIEYGLNPEEIYQHIYSSKTASHLRLLGILLQNVKISKSGKVAWIEMNRSLRSKYKATADETLSFLNLLLLIREAEVICFFREEDDGKTRVSIKSKGKIIISQLAMKLGGGGHDYAAGLALSTSLRQTRLLVISQIEKLIKTQGNNSL